MESNTNILDLSIEELELIFTQIKNIVDQNNLALAHPKLREAFVFYHRDIFKKICLQTARTVSCRNKLQWIGQSITKIYDGGYCMTGKGLALAQEFCPNLKSINICITSENIAAAQLYLPKMQKLEEIQLRGPCFIAKLLECLQKLPHLQRLCLWDFNFNGTEKRQLNSLTQLRHLEINSLECADIRKMSQMLRNLHTLHLYTVPESETLQELAIYCANLEYLHLYDANKSLAKTIGYFRKLKYLEIHDAKSSAYFLFNSFDCRYNTQLQELIIPGKYIYEKEADRIVKLQALHTLACVMPDVRCLKYIVQLPLLVQLTLFNCTNLTNSYLLFLLRRCKTLRRLEITLCSRIDANFIDIALKILSSNGIKPHEPFDLQIYGSGIHMDANEKLSSNALFNLLNLTYN